MPGISFIYNPDLSDSMHSEFGQALANTCHNDRYQNIPLIEKKNVLVAKSTYPEYPIETFDINEFQAVFEGRIYNKSRAEIAKDLQEIYEIAFSKKSVRNMPEDQLGKILPGYDGEFVIVMVDKNSERFLIFNDVLGKLPFYYSNFEQSTIASRDIKLVRLLIPDVQFDPNALAYFLMLKYYPRGMTPFKSISKFPPGSFLLRRHAGDKSGIQRCFIPDLSENHSITSLDACARDLALTLSSAIKNRNRDRFGFSALALSGGLDSRLVLAAFKSSSQQAQIYSSLNADNGNTADVDIAQECAAIADYEFNRIQLEKLRFEPMEYLAECKSGLNNVYMAVSFGLYESIITEMGWGTDLYTGDGGAAVKTPYRMRGIIKTPADLKRFIFDAQACFPDEVIEKLLSVDCNELKHKFIEYTGVYPAADINDTYLHYIVQDYLTYFGYEGEDRSRLFHWTQTPCEAPQFYFKALRVPDKYKTNLKLTSKMLEILYPPLTGPDYADYGAGIKSLKTKMALNIKRLAYKYPGLLTLIRNVRSKTNRATSIRDYPDYERLLNLIESSETVNDILDPQCLRQLLNGKLNNLQYYHLLTVLLAIKSVEKSQD